MMVVDDSVVIRGLISRWIGAEPDMVVVASLRTGLEAVQQLDRIKPDVAVLDIEMPELDGISALPQLLAKKRDLIIIMASTLTRRNAEISFKALSLGASDYIPKPESTREPAAAEIFHHDLIQKIRAFGAKVRRTAPPYASPPLAPSQPHAEKPRDAAAVHAPAPRPVAAQPALMRRAFGLQAPRVLVVGSLDRRTAGADVAGYRTRSRDRSLSGADHPAHAADLHDHSRRASGAIEPASRRMRPSTASRSSRAGSISRPADATCASCVTARKRRSRSTTVRP